MGYSEIHCQLCGVSFAIARLRRADEPEDAAWCYSGHPNGYRFVEVDESAGDAMLCGDDSGCSTHDEGAREGEHIAGPGCVSQSGYSGYRISLEEMKGCRAVQCLVVKGIVWTPEDADEDVKGIDWTPEDDDEDFEVEGRHFLTGIGDGSPDCAPLEIIDPVRHGIDNVFIHNMVRT